MIEMRRTQLGFGDGLIAEEVRDLREDWMTDADAVLADEEILAAFNEMRPAEDEVGGVRLDYGRHGEFHGCVPARQGNLC
jgi:hypothetical protein